MGASRVLILYMVLMKSRIYCNHRLQEFRASETGKGRMTNKNGRKQGFVNDREEGKALAKP